MSELKPGEHTMTATAVAAIFNVDPKIVTRWANTGKLPCRRTLGGHRRYREADVIELLQKATPTAAT